MNKTSKIASLILALFLFVSLASCGNTESGTSTNTYPSTESTVIADIQDQSKDSASSTPSPSPIPDQILATEFNLNDVPQYRLTSDNEREGIPYRLSCPLAQYVLCQAQGIELPTGKITFIPGNNTIRVTLPEYLQKAHGYLQLSNLDITAFDNEQYSILTAYTSDGTPVPQEDCEKLFLCAGTSEGVSPLADGVLKKLQQNTKQHITGKLQTIDSRNLVYFRAEEDRIFRWEQDMVSTLEKELDTVKRQIREMERVSRQAQSMEEKLEANRRLQELERQKRKKRNELADREDEIGEQRKRMIAALDRRMVKQTSSSDVFVIEWQVK